MKIRLLAVLFAGIATFGPATARGQAPRGDLARLQGVWHTRIKAPRTGGELTLVLVFQGDTIATTVGTGDGRTSRTVGQVKINESARPATIDFVGMTTGQLEVPDSLGIFELNGDTLTICGGSSTRRPTRFRDSERDQIRVITYKRGEPTAGAPRGQAGRGIVVRGSGANEVWEIAGATVVKPDRQGLVSLKTQDGIDVHVRPAVGQAFAADGTALTREQAARVLSEGNVLDVVLKKDSQQGAHSLAKVRLVRDAPALAAPRQAPAIEVYRGAIVARVESTRVVLSVNGRFVDVGRTNRDTIALDLQGRQMPAGQQARLLKEGNKIDLVLWPRGSDPRLLPTIREIHLVQGQLADIAQSLNVPKRQ